MDNTNKIIMLELVLITVFSSMLIFQSGGLTGLAVQTGVTKESIQKDIEATIPKLNFIDDIKDSSLCLIVNVNLLTSYSYEIVKMGDALAVTSSEDKLCKGTNNEDFIVAYASYDKFKEHVASPPTVQDLRKEGDGSYFQIYPSSQILSGGKIAYPSQLDSKIGTVLRKNLPSQEVQQLLNPSSPEERQASSLTSYVFYFIIGLIVLVLVVSLMIVKFSKKPEIKIDLELTSYIKASISQGYSQEQIKQALLQSGWEESKIQEALTSVNVGVTSQEVKEYA